MPEQFLDAPGVRSGPAWTTVNAVRGRCVVAIEVGVGVLWPHRCHLTASSQRNKPCAMTRPRLCSRARLDHDRDASLTLAQEFRTNKGRQP